MARFTSTLRLLASAALLLNLAACATSRQWNVSGGNRDEGVVRVSYEYPEFKQPELSD